MSPDKVPLVSAYADVLQIGARNMQNYALLHAVGEAQKPVLLKRGMMSTMEELLMSAEYILSHGNDRVILCERGIRTFERYTRNTLDISAVPVIASHSSARHFTPGWERNMSDEMITALADNGGIIMINFGSAFITQQAQDYSTRRSAAYDQYVLDNDLEKSDAAEATFREAYSQTAGPYPYATLDETLDHFDHVVKLTSVDHVGIGSDYDGVGDSLPVGLKDVSTYPNLVEGLLARGYSEADVRKILGGNLLRVWREVQAAAEMR
jgi:microsomal dipeptidase-like Zn-dependent dipeptidase